MPEDQLRNGLLSSELTWLGLGCFEKFLCWGSVHFLAEGPRSILGAGIILTGSDTDNKTRHLHLCKR